MKLQDGTVSKFLFSRFWSRVFCMTLGWQLVNSFEDICRPGLCLSMSEPGVTNIFTSSKTSWVTLWGGYQKKERKHSCTNHSCSAVDYQ